MTDLQAARARLAARQQQAELPTWRPTPTRAETTAIAGGARVMLKEWDQSPIDPAALDAVFDPDELPLPPAEIPIVFGLPVCGHELHASPGKITPRRIFQWTRDGVAIVGANALRYRLVAADVGCAIGFSATRSRMTARSRQIGPVVGPAKR